MLRCKKCAFATPNPHSLAKHMVSHNNSKYDYLFCQYCTYTSNLFGNLKRHHKVGIAFLTVCLFISASFLVPVCVTLLSYSLIVLIKTSLFANKFVLKKHVFNCIFSYFNSQYTFRLRNYY